MTGTILGSLCDPQLPCCVYFVEWDDRKRNAVFVVEWKLALQP
jgi:hypothetical protein